MEIKHIWRIGIGALSLATIPIVIYIRKLGAQSLSGDIGTWNAFSGYLNGIVGLLLSFITLMVTVYIAYSVSEYGRRRDKQNKDGEDLKAYLELFQYFTGPEFREKRHIAWNVIRRGVENPAYAAFIVKETFVGRYSDRTLRQKVYDDFQGIYKRETFEDKQSFLHRESEDRHKVDAVMNFFELLAVKDVPADNHKVFDFYYDSWRPLLCWYAKRLEEAYNLYEENKQFNNPPCLREAIALLDKKYYKPTVPDTLTVDTIDEHPILKWYASRQDDEG